MKNQTCLALVTPPNTIYIIRARTRERNTRTTAVYLERFFRNLLLGEKWDLRNRFLHIHASDEWKVQPNLAYATSTQQVEDKYGTSAGQVQDKLQTDDANIKRLVLVIGNLKPAVREGYVRLLYPNSPRHPRQKYLLTMKGLALYNELKKEKQNLL